MRGLARAVLIGGAMVGIASVAAWTSTIGRPVPQPRPRVPAEAPERYEHKDLLHWAASNGAASSSGKEAPSVAMEGILVTDVGGDGREDIVDVFATGKDGSPWLGAVSGADGHVFWKNEDAVSRAGAGSLRALVGSELVVVDGGTAVEVIHPSDGTIAWRQLVPSTVVEICDNSSVLEVRLLQGELLSFDLANGHAASVAPGVCTAAYTSKSAGPNFRSLNNVELAASLRGQTTVLKSLVPFVGTARVLLAEEQTTGAPVVAVVSGDKLLWQGPVAAEGTSAKFLDTPVATVRYNRVVVPYVLRGGGASVLRVAAFDLARGDRVWDSDIPHESEGGRADIAISRDRQVFFRTPSGRLVAFDLGTSAYRSLVGGS
jgi:outer membrane protein assembly factor BamB